MIELSIIFAVFSLISKGSQKLTLHMHSYAINCDIFSCKNDNFQMNNKVFLILLRYLFVQF